MVRRLICEVRYIEQRDGDIILDPGPGVGRCTSVALPGPGSYAAETGIFRRPHTMATFGKCRSRRSLFETIDNPGPGQYTPMAENTTAITEASLRDAYDDSRMAVFKSGCALTYQKVRSHHSTDSIRHITHMSDTKRRRTDTWPRILSVGYHRSIQALRENRSRIRNAREEELSRIAES